MEENFLVLDWESEVMTYDVDADEKRMLLSRETLQGFTHDRLVHGNLLNILCYHGNHFLNPIFLG